MAKKTTRKARKTATASKKTTPVVKEEVVEEVVEVVETTDEKETVTDESVAKETAAEENVAENVKEENVAEEVVEDVTEAPEEAVEDVVEAPTEEEVEVKETPVEASAEDVTEASAEDVVEKENDAQAEDVVEEVPVVETKEEGNIETVAEDATSKEKEAEETKAEEKKAPAKKAPAKKTTTKKTAAKKTEETKAEETTKKKTAKKATTKKASAEEAKEETEEAKPVEESVVEEPVVEEKKIIIDYSTPRRSVAFIGSECYPFVKTGGLGEVMYALPKALVKQNCDVKVIIPRYKCIPWEYQEKMVYKGAFQMDLCSDGRSYYVGIMEYECDGVVYDFIDNEEFFSAGNPYISLVDDIPKYCFFSKAALAALNYLNWVPDIIHCHDWQAALVPVFLRTMFEDTKLCTAKTILTIHNLRFQGIYNIPTIKYWTNLPNYVFEMNVLKENYTEANMLKGGLTYSNIITTVSHTYAYEIQTPYYGEHLDSHLRYHSGKLRGIVNGIDYDIWNSATDDRLHVNYDIQNVLEKKKESKLKMQEELGLEQNEHKFVIGLISRLTDQKGLDLINCIIPQIMDEHTQLVVLGTGDGRYEDAFRYYENKYKGRVCSNIMYDETRSHRIYAGADAFLVPSQFEPCGLTQLIAMHYGTIPIVRETGGLKDTVEPYNMFDNTGNGFTFDHYDAGLLLDAINRAKTLYFEHRKYWDEMVKRDMQKDLSWENSAKQYKDLYLELTR